MSKRRTDDMHARDKKIITYDIILSAAFQAILFSKRIEIRIPFIWGLRVYELCSLLRLRQNGING